MDILNYICIWNLKESAVIGEWIGIMIGGKGEREEVGILIYVVFFNGNKVIKFMVLFNDIYIIKLIFKILLFFKCFCFFRVINVLFWVWVVKILKSRNIVLFN